MAGKPRSVMTSTELLRFQIDDAGYQLEKVLEGLDGSHVDGKPVATAMSMRETVAHLGEAYQATITEAAGGSHSWGSFQIDTDNWAGLVEKVMALRAQAADAALASEDEDKGAKSAHAFIIAHDYYHVGQLAVIRIAIDSAWDPYCIYRH